MAKSISAGRGETSKRDVGAARLSDQLAVPFKPSKLTATLKRRALKKKACKPLAPPPE